jgi:hypothetical protein
MTTLSNREKNILHEARLDARVRPATPAYDFEGLASVMRQWVTGSATAPEEVYSPYYGA